MRNLYLSSFAILFLLFTCNPILQMYYGHFFIPLIYFNLASSSTAYRRLVTLGLRDVYGKDR